MAEWTARRDDSGGKPGLWSVTDASGAIVFFGMHEDRARLFAAAPEMLAALKAAEQRLDESGTGEMGLLDTIHAVYAIIKPARLKAEGIAKAEPQERADG